MKTPFVENLFLVNNYIFNISYVNNLEFVLLKMYTDNMFFKENLATLRKRENLSQNDLSIKLNVKRYNVSDWEQGRSEPSIEMLCTISEFFGIDLDEILNDNLSIMKDEDLKFCRFISR